MNMWLDILPLGAGIASLILAAVVSLSSQNITSKWSFVLFAFSMGVWAVFISLFLLATDATWASLYAQVYYVAALLLAYSFLVFCVSFARAKGVIARGRPYLIVFFVATLAMSWEISQPSSLVQQVYLAPGGNTAILNTWLYVIYSLMFLTFGLLGLVTLTRKRSRQKFDVRTRQQLRLIAGVMWVCLPTGALFNLILPLIGNYSLIMVGPLFALPIVATVFYAMIYQKLFDIRTAIIRMAAYTLTLAVLGALYVGIAYAASRLLLGRGVHPPGAINVISALVLAFLFQPVRQFFDRVTNRVFYHGMYDVDDFLATLSRLLASTVDLRSVLEQAARHIAQTFGTGQVFFLVNENDTRQLLAGTPRHSRLSAAEVFALEQYFAACRYDTMALTDRKLINNHAIASLLGKHRIAMVFPLVRAEQLIGVMFVGEYQGAQYKRRDIKVLLTVLNELVIAIQNALSVQEVRELNSTLQRRVNDATKELRKSNKELQRLDEAKDEFVSMASHQLRTPLTSVKGYIDMVLQGDAGKITPMQHQLLSEAFTSSERMVHLINDFLNVSRLQTGKFMLDRRPVDLAKLVGQEVDSLRTTASARSLELRYRAPARLPVLYLDADKLRQVVMNFIDNAIYYSREDSAITVKLRAEQGDVVLEVHDTGIGVPKDEQAHLFTKFFRAANARKQRPDGTGVGLYLAKKVITEHGGSMVFSSVEGKGSVFGFRLPIRRLESAPAEDADELNH